MTLRDVDGCENDTTFIIIDPPVLTVSLSDITQTSCPGTCDGAATANPSGGLGDYSYEWFDNTTGLTISVFDQTANTLCAGEYFVVVTDDNGCSVTSSVVTIDDADPIVLDAIPYPVSCFGLCDGSAAVDATGGAGGYTYSWTTFPAGVGIGATDSISGLCPGEYQIIVTDVNLCPSAPVVVEVLEPTELTLTFLDGNNPSCYDECDGEATVVPSGGTPIYNYSWSPLPIVGDGTPNVSGLCGDQEYTVEVTDDNGCMATASTMLVQPDEYDVASIVTDIDCFGDDDGAIAIVVISGGSGAGYTYTWSPTPPFGDGTTSVSGLTAGTWEVTVEDSEGCDSTLSFEITSPPELVVTTNVISNVNCNGICEGSAEVIITGGTGAYTILWDDPDAQDTPVASDLCAGTYNVTVTDENGCTGTGTVTITQPDPFDITVTQTNVECFGECNGTATVTVNSGGEDPYTILWDDDLAQETFTAIGLCADDYVAIVTDNNLCDTTIMVTITEPIELTADGDIQDNSCFGVCSGFAFVTPGGGAGGYTYQWFDATTDLAILGETNDSIFNLCPGDYYAIVTDANGCTAQTLTLSILELSEIVATVESTTDATCAVCDGTASISVTGGAGGYTIDWTPDPGAGEGTTDVTGLCSGAYSVLITDANNCTEMLTVSINDIALEVLDLDSVDVTCNGACDGQAIVNFVELDPPYTVEWFDVATGLTTGIFGNTATGLCAGEYLAVVTNGSGCISTGSIVINEYDAITGTITSTDASCFGHCDGMASVAVGGGVPPYTFDWGIPLPGSGEGTPDVIGLCAGPWEVAVTDDAGCTVTFTTTVDEPSDVSIDAESSSDISCFGITDGTASVIVSGGTGPYTYEWINCATGISIGQTDPLATGLDVGDYECIITDANSCSITSSCLPVADADEITTIINVENISCYGECDGLISVIPSGGAGTYFYQWLNEAGDPIAGQTNDSLENVCSGVYNIEITDLNGCVQTFGPIDQTAPSSPWDVVVTQTDITCSGGMRRNSECSCIRWK